MAQQLKMTLKNNAKGVKVNKNESTKGPAIKSALVGLAQSGGRGTNGQPDRKGNTKAKAKR